MAAMRLVIATCTVDYQGRLEAHLPSATRLLMCKADGSISIHADGGAYKPLNWMTPPCRMTEEPGRWTVTNPKGEVLTITMEEIHADVAHEAGLALVRREYPTDIGPVDLLCRDPDGATVAVEIKRRGDIDGVEQLARYLERLDLDGRLRPVRGIFAAQQIRPQAQVLARARGITCVEIDYDELRGKGPGRLTLF
jgi:RecB family endonuclease NucS